MQQLGKKRRRHLLHARRDNPAARGHRGGQRRQQRLGKDVELLDRLHAERHQSAHAPRRECRHHERARHGDVVHLAARRLQTVLRHAAHQYRAQKQHHAPQALAQNVQKALAALFPHSRKARAKPAVRRVFLLQPVQQLLRLRRQRVRQLLRRRRHNRAKQRQHRQRANCPFSHHVSFRSSRSAAPRPRRTAAATRSPRRTRPPSPQGTPSPPRPRRGRDPPPCG